MIDTNTVEVMRSKYRYQMKKSVTIINKLLTTSYNEDVDNLFDVIDGHLENFSKSKEKARHFEDILKVISESEKKMDDGE